MSIELYAIIVLFIAIIFLIRATFLQDRFIRNITDTLSMRHDSTYNRYTVKYDDKPANEGYVDRRINRVDERISNESEKFNMLCNFIGVEYRDQSKTEIIKEAKIIRKSKKKK